MCFVCVVCVVCGVCFVCGVCVCVCAYVCGYKRQVINMNMFIMNQNIFKMV